MDILRQSRDAIQVYIEGLQHQLSDAQTELITYQKRCEQYEQAYEQLQHQVTELRRYRFGKRSERFVDDSSDSQLKLFSPAINLSAVGFEVPENEIEVPAYRPKKRKPQKQVIPTRIEIIPVCDKDKQCSCGQHKSVIRYEIKQLAHYQPPVYEVIEQRREVVACPKGCDGAIKIAPAPLHILPKAKVTEEFLASLIVGKLDDRQPLYHLEKQLEHRHGILCPRQTMARWFIELKMPVQPIYNLLKDEAVGYDISSCDATTLQVLHEPERAPETKSYVYCMRGGPPDKNVILYAYNDKLHKQFVKEWYEGFKGYLEVDGDNFFDLIGAVKNVELSNCNAHARRKFEPVVKASTREGLAAEALRFFKALYKIERQAKDQKLTAAERYALRQQESKPLTEKFKQWLEEHYPTVLPKSPLGKAMEYCIKLWPGLTKFLDDGRLEIDNNLTEQEIKPLVISRKNFLFASSVDGAHALCLHLSLIRTAKHHKLDPYHYYVKLLKGIVHCRSVEDYEKLLPWNINRGSMI